MSDTKVAARSYIIGPTQSFFVVPAVTYVGPGDVQAFAHWYGFRAYNAAAIGTKKIARISGVDYFSVAGGAMDPAAPNGGSLDILYDQVGSNDLTPSGTPTYSNGSFNGVSGPIGSASVSGSNFMTGSGSNISQPWSISAAFKKTAVAQQSAWGSGAGGTVGMLHENAEPGRIGIATNFAGTILWSGGTFATNTPVAANGLWNGGGTGSIIDAHGTQTSGALNADTSQATFEYGAWTAVSGFQGNVAEIGVITGGSSAILANLSTNQRNYWVI